MTRVIALCLVLGLVAVTSFGCMKCGQNVSQKIAEKAIEGAVDKATGGRASIQVGKDVDISDMPALLRYPGATATGRYSLTGKEGTGTVYTFETEDPAASVADFYKKALAGWKKSSTMESEGAMVMSYGTENEKEFVTLTISREKDLNATSLTLLYRKKD